MTLQEKITNWKREGRSAIEIQKLLRDQGTPVPFLEVRKLYQGVK
jgi:hypothetical protein